MSHRNINGDLITPLTEKGLNDRQRILKRLLDARLENRARIYIDGGSGNQVIRSGGYCPMYDFDDICTARDVRLRDLRNKHAIPVSSPPHKFTDAYYYNSEGKRVRYDTPQYRIELAPETIRRMDWSRFWQTPMVALYDWHQMFISPRSQQQEKPSLTPIVKDDGQTAFV